MRDAATQGKGAARGNVKKAEEIQRAEKETPP